MIAPIDDLGVRPFNARSLVLSVLLGLPDGRLPLRSLLRLADEFEIAPGTMRTALSRLAAAGEVRAVGGTYELSGRLLERKQAQDTGRRPPGATWDGTWWVVLVTAPSRGVAERRAFRTHMVNARMGELRPECWLRPANIDLLAGLTRLDGVVTVRGPLDGEDAATMLARLWDLDAVAARCHWLRRRLDDRAHPASLPDAMALSAAVVRFLREEPLLPDALTPPDWKVDELRRAYRRYDRAFGAALDAAIR